MRLLVFDPGFEEELARRGPVPPPARPDPVRERLERRLAARFAFLGGAGDALLASWSLPDEFRRSWSGRGVELPAVVSEAPPGVSELVPWGAAPSLARLAPAPLPPLEAVRRANSKAFGHELAARLGLERVGEVCAHDRAVEAGLARFGPDELWVVKRAFGFAARGHLLGRGPALPPNGAGWLRRAFEAGDPVVLEPWLPRERDFSVQLEVSPDGAVRVLGILEMIAGRNGGYLGNRFGALGLAPALRARLESAALGVGRELAREGYFGPAGIDAFVHSGGKLRALCEVNGRYTFGRVSLALERLLAPGGVGAWVAVPTEARERAARLGLSTDPWPHEPGEGSCVLLARDRGELAALEERVLG